METFSAYNSELNSFTQNVLSTKQADSNLIKDSKSLLSSRYVEKELRRLISIGELRKYGSFFTGDNLATQAVDSFDVAFRPQCQIIDPACGAGNLLIAASKKLPVCTSLLKTAKTWGQQLSGFDLHEEFIEATKLRLILEAIQRGAEPDTASIKKLKDAFTKIQTGNLFHEDEKLANATHLVLNPPFNKVTIDKKCDWARGHSNAAALVLEHCLLHAPEGQQIVAILPDILRSGTRYEKWRSIISKMMSIQIDTIGRFDPRTDVDVFLLKGTRTNQDSRPTWTPNTSAISLSKFFDVSVGPVVPHRHAQKGPAYPYILPVELPVWKEIRVEGISHKRKFGGRVVKPPFVAIRRTSSPSDRNRAPATLLRGKMEVAVENHLIIAQPKSGKVSDCKKLLKILKSPKTNEFLNQRIRCRHLTVSAIKEIPCKGI